MIIGDELLNARRKDKHLENSIELLAARGLQLHRSLIIGDEPDLIVETIQYLNTENDVVFSFGGIGATPDDYTRQCAAKAFSEPLAVHEEGRKILEDKFAEKAYPHRINMVTIPRGSRLIPNPYNNIPGFSYADFHFVPGFPQMAKPMVEWVLDNCYQALQPETKLLRKSVLIYGKGEGELVDMMNELLENFPDIKLSCLPRIDLERNYVELSLLGVSEQVGLAFQFVLNELDNMMLEWELSPQMN